ncbi:MAG: HAD family hydrolase [Anaerolineae bacterium]|nr:MAG: HAD family hydrolase [Anaerolineae bacterium]
MIRGVIFDFDGLILDTETPVFRSWQELYARFGQRLTLEDWAEVVGCSAREHYDPLERLQQRLGQPLDVERWRAWRYEREMALLAEQDLLPGVTERLEEARRLGLRLAVASSSPRPWVEGHLQRLGLWDYFQVVHTAEDVERTKPAPLLFQKALRSLALQPPEAIVFEDSPNGVTAAKAAGIFCVAVPNAVTQNLPLDHADLRITSLAEITLRQLIRER